MTDGTTLCPHCATRFRIAEAQLSAHGGMVRCGYCREAFDARTNYLPDQPSPQLDLLTEENQIPEALAAEHTEPDTEAFQSSDIQAQEEAAEIAPDDEPASELPEHETVADTEVLQPPESDDIALPTSAPASDDTADSSDAMEADEIDETEPLPTDEIPETGEASAENPSDENAAVEEQVALTKDELTDYNVSDANDGFQAATDEPAQDSQPYDPNIESPDSVLDEAPVKPATWPWITGIVVLIILLIAQSAYFFRVSLAAHLPGLKPALVSYCGLLNCDVPLPRNPELMSIDSSSLNADPDHENQVNLDALLRNRASYTLAFPVLSLTLNDMQDKPLASRTFVPADYLPPGETEARGLPANHELSIQLHMDTGDLRPVGYRLELYYPE